MKVIAIVVLALDVLALQGCFRAGPEDFDRIGRSQTVWRAILIAIGASALMMLFFDDTSSSIAAVVLGTVGTVVTFAAAIPILLYWLIGPYRLLSTGRSTQASNVRSIHRSNDNLERHEAQLKSARDRVIERELGEANRSPYPPDPNIERNTDRA